MTHALNPNHPVVTGAVNTARGIVGAVRKALNQAITHCPRGHPYDEENTYIGKRGERNCKECGRRRSMESKLQRNAGKRKHYALLRNDPLWWEQHKNQKREYDRQRNANH